MKIKKSKVTRIITVLLSTVMFFEQFATTDAMFYSHAEDVLSEDYSIEHRITSTWDGGCSAEIILTNLSDKDTKDWTVTFCTTDEITNLWGGTITECREQKTSYGTENKDEKENGKENVEETDNYYGTPDSDDECTYYCYTIKAVNYNGVIGAGKGITIGYNASGDDHDIWDESAELAFESEKTEEVNGAESQSNEKGVVNEKIEDTTYVFESEDYAVNYTVQSHWDGHCNVKIEIENHSKEKMNNWNLTFFTEDMINNPYNAILVADGNEEGRITLKNAGYNQDIIAGGSVSFGFEVLYGERFDRPEAFYLGDEESVVSRDLYTFTNTITSEWDDGCTGALTIQNLGENVIEDWSLVLRVDGSIISTWGGNLKEIGNGIYEIECPDHSQNILAGDSVTIGYQAVQKPDITLLELREKNSLPNGMGTSVSSNGEHYTNDVGEEQHIFINTSAFRLEDMGVYFVDEEVEFMSGYTDYDCAFEVASMTVEDVFGDVVWDGCFTSEDGYVTWSAENIGFVIGCNILIFTLTDVEGNEIKEPILVVNSEKANMDRTLIGNGDTDEDGIDDYYEKFYDTDPEKADTDGDGLSDFDEVYLLDFDPTKADSDDDGILDMNEDEDGDGLNVVQEIEIGLNDWSDDFDGDGLKDGYEVNAIGTDPKNPDTDHDGFTDKEEVALGLNPLNSDSDGDGVPDGEEVIAQTRTYSAFSERSAVENVSVGIKCKGSVYEQVHINENLNTIIAKTPGIIGKPMDIEVDFSFDTADIIFTYDESMLGDSKEDNLKLMWYNEAENEYVLLEDSVCDAENNTVTYTTTHFSTYFLLDEGKWKEYSTEPIDYTEDTKTVEENYDFIVFIDYTVSEEDLAREQQIVTSLISNMEDGDRMMFFYVISDNLEMITDRNGTYTWATTQAEALNNMDPNTGISPLELFMRGGYSTSDTYDGRAEYSLEALNYANSKGNKKVAYLLYPGTYYDSTFRQNNAYMMTEASKAQSAGSVFNTISISYSPSAELDNYVQMLGGKQYSGDEASIMEAISEDLSKRIVYSYGNVDTTDSDGDGLYDVWEIKGMRAANGWVVRSDPNKKDTDGDGYDDGEEVGRRDLATRDFPVYSDPGDPDSIPHAHDAVYILAWSYNRDTVKAFEEKHKNEFPELNGDGFVSEWTKPVLELFEEEDGFSRAAQTMRMKLIESGIDPNQIIVKRIDGDNYGYSIDLRAIWNNEWKKYIIRELHLFTHGYNGYPYMYNSTASVVWRTNDYNVLNWTKDATVYFHGCHTADEYLFQEDDDIKYGFSKSMEHMYPLQLFANAQGVVTYGNKYGTRLSANPRRFKNIELSDSQEVYMGMYGIPWGEMFDKDDIRKSKWYLFPEIQERHIKGNRLLDMTAFYPQ